MVTQWPLLRPRLGLSVEGVEIRSVDERSGLEASARTLIGEHPWLGVGYGNFTIALWQRKPPALEAYPIYQPVHRVPLLVLAELGLPGAALWLILAVGPWVTIWRRRKSLARTRFACCADRSDRRRDRRADRCQLVRLLSVVQPAGSVADVDIVGVVGGKRDA